MLDHLPLGCAPVNRMFEPFGDMVSVAGGRHVSLWAAGASGTSTALLCFRMVLQRTLSTVLLAASPAIGSLRAENSSPNVPALAAVPDALIPTAKALFESNGHTLAQAEESWMDGGFRGKIHLVPAWPTGSYAKHAAWVEAAARDHRAVLDVIGAAVGPIRFRADGLAFRFMRSVNRTTPNAYVNFEMTQRAVYYNVSGSLLSSEPAVRELLWHEIFHLSDAADGYWSGANLRAIFNSIVERCQTKRACLAPFAPTETTVRGGTYYAFQPNNGDTVLEYAAEVALRYYREQRAMIRNGRLQGPAFKCQTPENHEAYVLVAERFFGGFDRTPVCGR